MRTQSAGEMDSVFLIAAWFRRHPQERARILQPDEVLARLTQTGAATKADSVNELVGARLA
jgi:hypothetical protein